MLVITRLRGESVTIDGDIKITVLGTRHKASLMRSKRPEVRLGIEAPEGVTILRSEVPDRRRE